MTRNLRGLVLALLTGLASAVLGCADSDSLTQPVGDLYAVRSQAAERLSTDFLGSSLNDDDVLPGTDYFGGDSLEMLGVLTGTSTLTFYLDPFGSGDDKIVGMVVSRAQSPWTATVSAVARLFINQLISPNQMS